MNDFDDETKMIKEIMRTGTVMDFIYKKHQCKAYKDSLSDYYVYFVIGGDTVYGYHNPCTKKELKKFLKKTVNEML